MNASTPIPAPSATKADPHHEPLAELGQQLDDGGGRLLPVQRHPIGPQEGRPKTSSHGERGRMGGWSEHDVCVIVRHIIFSIKGWAWGGIFFVLSHGCSRGAG